MELVFKYEWLIIKYVVGSGWNTLVLPIVRDENSKFNGMHPWTIKD